MSKAEILTSEHVFIPGRTGSGKTFLAESYLNGFDNVIVLDTKGFFNWKTSEKHVPVFENLESMSNFGQGRAIYRPDFTELNQEFYDSFFQWIYKRKNTIVYIDELMEVCPSPRTYPLYLKGILTRGREMNIGCWMSTQRPKDIPSLCLNQSTHFFIFNLQEEADREKISKSIERPEVLKNPGTFESYIFWYYNSRTQERPIRARLKPKT
jgi:hypothetical protein